ncbi:MAG UNVERIFIED_CONTAM: S46 family peptidase [Planctomycetaceae bacterium]|jgi:radical SAM protein with 4Fe4S-binding SPASM domain
MKSLANVEKRSRGQLLGLRRAGIVEARTAQEQRLQEFIASNPDRNSKYGRVLTEIAAVYAEMSAAGPQEILLQQLRQACRRCRIRIFCRRCCSRTRKTRSGT